MHEKPQSPNNKRDLSSRKADHIDLCQSADVESGLGPGFEKLRIKPRAFAPFHFSDIDLQQNYLGKTFQYPLFITGMTGGTDQAQKINLRLAEVAESYGIPMGVGSQRIAIEHPELRSIFEIKQTFPKVFLIGNIGISQLVQSTDPLSLAKQCVDMIDADALAIHLNTVQELVQAEGDSCFYFERDKLKHIAENLGVPVVIKETGCGIDLKSAQEFIQCGVSAIDTGGMGGTSWPWIEGLRSTDEGTQRLGGIFRNWGLNTVESLMELAPICQQVELSATGGIRSGVDVLKALALGAKMSGIGLPFFKAACVSSKKVESCLEDFIRQLKVAMMGSGQKNLNSLDKSIFIGESNGGT